MKDMGASPDGDRATGLRPQPPAASSQSSVPSAVKVYDPRQDGFTNARLMLAVGSLTMLAAKRNASLAYGAWNPDFCSADAAREALHFFHDVIKFCDHYADQAASAMSASGQDPKGLEAKPASAAPEGGDAQ